MLLWRGATAWALVVVLVVSQSPDIQESLEKYAPKSCKYNLLPSTVGSRAYKGYTGEVHIYDVFGMPAAVKRHTMRLDISKESIITLQAEVHRDTPTTLTVDVFRRGAEGKSSGRILLGRNSLGAGGEDTKAFLHGLLNEKEHGEIDIVFELISVEVAAAQVDMRTSEERCWPVRLDLAVIPTSRTALHWPTSCPDESRLPPPIMGSEVKVLPDSGLKLDPLKAGEHFSFRFGEERPWEGFGRSLWSGTIEVPPRLHRFARIFVRASFRFPSAPLQLVLELFDLKEVPDGTALTPKCEMGCLGGVPVYNGQILDHAMPAGFRYRLWLLAASLEEWTAAVPDRGRHCVDFDFDYSVKYEEKLTPFEVGPTAWLCEFTRLPVRIVQTPSPKSNEKAKENVQLVVGRTIWIRDRFGFPPEEVSDMEHKIQLVVDERSFFRATTHHSDGVDVFLALTREGETQRACPTFRHPGPVPRQTIFCRLEPGTYTLTVFADYPLGGLHPCSDFFAQISLRPTVLESADHTRQCLASESDLTKLKVKRSLELTTTPQWKTMRVPIKFNTQASTSITIWMQSIEILQEEEQQHLYLRLVVHSDYVSSDIRFQVKYEGKYIADTQVTSHGYADMIGPLDAGTYTVAMYYVVGLGPNDEHLCSTSMVDLRVVAKSQYVNKTAQWLCSSTRVPPPDVLAPQPDEQVLLDSDYLVPSSGIHTIRVQVSETRLLRIQGTSQDADFKIALRKWPELTPVASDMNNVEIMVAKGQYALRIKALMRGMGSGASCSTMRLNLLLQPTSVLPECPWSGSSSSYNLPADLAAQVEASDHIGNALLDLVPQHLTQDTKPKPPVTLWMNQGMEKSFEMVLDSSAAMRLEVVVQPPFLPLSVTVRKKRPSGKIEPSIAAAEWMESRLLLMQNELPKGKYLVEFKMERKYTVMEGIDGGEAALANMCAHVTIFAEVGVTSKEAINSMRAELLDLPDLLAVQPFPPNFNMVGWFSSPLTPMLGTQVYNFPNGPEKATLKVDDKAVLRLVCEPADLSNAEASLRLLKDGKTVTEGDNLGQLVAEVDAGVFEVEMTPKAKAPFLVTAGFATMARLREDIMLQDSSRSCMDQVPELQRGVNFSPRGWTIGPVLVRLKSSWRSKTGPLAKVPVQVAAPSILYIEAGSSLPLDLIRIALEVPEGLWVGEQRGTRNALQIELPPGKYNVQLSQPKVAGEGIPRCIDFSVTIACTPLNPDAAADAAAQLATEAGTISAGEANKRTELAPREEAAMETAPCFSMGTVPLPLDMSFPEGGSKVLGGPLGKDGRLLVRSRVMITDMHDGRKKMHLLTKKQKLTMKVGIIMGGFAHLSLASQLSFTVQRIGNPVVLNPVESWSQESGWERIYLLDESASGYWLSFHHPHRERSQSACLHFGLEIEIHPSHDTSRMYECNGEAEDAESMFPSSIDIDQNDDTTSEYRFKKPLTWTRQSKEGFLREMRFTLKEQSYVFAQLAHNYFLSHAEMDIVHVENQHESIVFGEPDFLHDTDNPLNSRQVVSRVLDAGEYKVRVADDHYPGQMAGVDTACFPFAFEFLAVPEKAAPAVVSVQPHPSVPVPKGVDFVITLRFSEPPEGTLEDVVKMISLGGVQAVAGGSIDAMKGQYASRTATVQAETSEGHKLWIIGWSSQVLTTLSEAKLTLGPIRSNVTKKRYNFNPPTYKVVEAPKGIPWAGSSSTSSSSSSDSSMPRPEGIPGEEAQHLPPEPQPASSGGGSGVGGLGEVKMEGGGSASSSAQPASNGQAVRESIGSSVGQSKPEGASTDTGMVHAEGAAAEVHAEAAATEVHAASPVTPAPAPPAESSPRQGYSEVHVEASYSTKEQEDYEPTVHQWVPTDSGGSRAAPAPPPDEDGETKCPPGTVMNGLTGICDSKVLSSSVLSSMADSMGSLSESMWPSGYGSVIAMCAGSIVLLAAIMNCGPQLKGLFGRFQSSASNQSSASKRFTDIGERRPEEEMGLVSAAAADFDDDML